MDKHSVFTSEFLSTIKAKLEEVCVDGAALTRKKLCESLGLDKVFEPTITTVIAAELVPGFDMTKGRGIGVKGVRPPKKPSGGVKIEITDEFKQLLKATLDDICPDDGKTCISRKEIAEAMGSPGFKTENMISFAFKSDEFSDFTTRAGRHGGVCRVLSDTESAVEKTPETIKMFPNSEKIQALSDNISIPIEEDNTIKVWDDHPESNSSDDLIDESVDSSTDEPTSDEDLLDLVLNSLSEDLDDDDENISDDVLSEKIAAAEMVDSETSWGPTYLRPDGPLAQHHAKMKAEKRAAETAESN